MVYAIRYLNSGKLMVTPICVLYSKGDLWGFRNRFASCLEMFGKASMSKQSFSSFDFFFKVFGYYARKMEISINSEISKGKLQKKKKRFYNYIIIRSGSLYKLILNFYTHELDRDGFDIS